MDTISQRDIRERNFSDKIIREVQQELLSTSFFKKESDCDLIWVWQPDLAEVSERLAAQKDCFVLEKAKRHILPSEMSDVDVIYKFLGGVEGVSRQVFTVGLAMNMIVRIAEEERAHLLNNNQHICFFFIHNGQVHILSFSWVRMWYTWYARIYPLGMCSFWANTWIYKL